MGDSDDGQRMRSSGTRHTLERRFSKQRRGQLRFGDDHEVAALHHAVQIEKLGQQITGRDDTSTDRCDDGPHAAAGT